MTKDKAESKGMSCGCGGCSIKKDSKCVCRFFAVALVVVLLVAGFMAFNAYREKGQAEDVMPMEVKTVHLERQDGTRFPLEVEIAKTPEQQRQGLSHRTAVEVGKGMLFVYDRPQEVRFWMKDTLIELDILFIQENGIIYKIVQRAAPHDETPIPSETPVVAVLEVAGGEVARLGVQPGDLLALD